MAPFKNSNGLENSDIFYCCWTSFILMKHKNIVIQIESLMIWDGIWFLSNNCTFSISLPRLGDRKHTIHSIKIIKYYRKSWYSFYHVLPHLLLNLNLFCKNYNCVWAAQNSYCKTWTTLRIKISLKI